MKQVTVGVIGLGLMGDRHARVFSQLPGVRLTAVADVRGERVESVAQATGTQAYTDYRDLLNRSDLDAVSICLPDSMHLEAVLAAAAAKKHILLEKPIATSLDEVDEMVAAAEKAGVTLMVGHILRFDPRFAMAEAAIREGRVGEPIQLYARRNSPIVGPRHYAGQADLATHVMVHDIDILNWFIKGRVTKVYAQGQNRILSQYKVYDAITATLNYDTGAIATIEAAWVLPESNPSAIDGRIEVIGNRGVLYVDTYEQGLSIVDAKGTVYPDTMHWPEIHGQVVGDLQNEILHFIQCVATGRAPLVGGAEARETVSVALAIMESISTQKPVGL